MSFPRRRIDVHRRVQCAMPRAKRYIRLNITLSREERAPQEGGSAYFVVADCLVGVADVSMAAGGTSSRAMIPLSSGFGAG